MLWKPFHTIHSSSYEIYREAPARHNASRLRVFVYISRIDLICRQLTGDVTKGVLSPSHNAGQSGTRFPLRQRARSTGASGKRTIGARDIWHGRGAQQSSVIARRGLGSMRRPFQWYNREKIGPRNITNLCIQLRWELKWR